jgi:ABC-type lipoprotein release transport system permease subunit
MVRRMLAAAIVTALAVAGALVVLHAGPPAPAPDVPGILVSRQLVERKQLHTGDLVRLAADPSGSPSRLFRVQGVYEPTPDPMRFAQPALDVQLHLPDLETLTRAARDPRDPGQADTVGAINVALADPAEARRFARDVTARLPGAAAAPTAAPNARTSTFLVIERFHLAVAIVTMLGSAVFLLALMIMLVDERRDTIGTLRLIGFTRRRILAQVLAEGAIIAAAGTLAGILFALAAQGAFNRFFQWRYDTALVFLRVTPGVVLQASALALPLGIAASLVASWTLLARHPIALVRR